MLSLFDLVTAQCFFFLSSFRNSFSCLQSSPVTSNSVDADMRLILALNYGVNSTTDLFSPKDFLADFFNF